MPVQFQNIKPKFYTTSLRDEQNLFTWFLDCKAKIFMYLSCIKYISCTFYGTLSEHASSSQIHQA